MKIDRSFDWLGRFPLAVDLADTVRVVSSEPIDLLTDEDALAIWVGIEAKRYASAEAARGRLHEVRSLRDAVRGVLLAQADGTPIPTRDLELINHASERCPSYPKLSESGIREAVELNDDPFQVFAAEVARSLIETMEGGPSVSVCRAPSCGMFFVPTDRRQRWCSPACGNRARVARHTARAAHHH